MKTSPIRGGNNNNNNHVVSFTEAFTTITTTTHRQYRHSLQSNIQNQNNHNEYAKVISSYERQRAPKNRNVMITMTTNDVANETCSSEMTNLATAMVETDNPNVNHDDGDPSVSTQNQRASSRRDIIQSFGKHGTMFVIASMVAGGYSDRTWSSSQNAYAAEFDTSSSTATRSTDDAEITNKIYIDIQGLPSSSPDAKKQQRIVIGLFGKEAPQPVQTILALASPQGWDTPCRPKVEKVLQKEQLEANKVYNSCIEQQDQGVTLRDSTIWRIFPNQQIDVGAVAGRFVAREYPNFQNNDNNNNQQPLRHDRPGIVSVRRGNEGGFGFTIYYYDAESDNTIRGVPNELDSTHIVVGKVLEGLDVLEALNRVPVVTSKLNFMALTGGARNQKAPDRSCRYGSGNVYCNENKPLIKLSIADTGILS